MNELYFLDGDLSPCGVADRYSRLVWDRQYYACGSFSLSLPLGYGDLPAGVYRLVVEGLTAEFELD